VGRRVFRAFVFLALIAIWTLQPAHARCLVAREHQRSDAGEHLLPVRSAPERGWKMRGAANDLVGHVRHPPWFELESALSARPRLVSRRLRRCVATDVALHAELADTVADHHPLLVDRRPFRGCSGILAFKKLRRVYRRRHIRCVECGYDLRTTTDRCPECGTAITSEQKMRESCQRELTPTTRITPLM